VLKKLGHVLGMLVDDFSLKIITHVC